MALSTSPSVLSRSCGRDEGGGRTDGAAHGYLDAAGDAQLVERRVRQRDETDVRPGTCSASADVFDTKLVELPVPDTPPVRLGSAAHASAANLPRCGRSYRNMGPT